MTEVDGVLMIISCKKYLHDRVVKNKYRLIGDSVFNWKVVYVVADKNISQDFQFGAHDEIRSNILIVKCEDDYLHLFKKIAFAMRALHVIFKIKKGIIKCDDDMLFIRKNLQKYLNGPLDIDFSAKSVFKDKYTQTGMESIRVVRDFSTHQYLAKSNSDSLRTMLKKNIDTFDKGYINLATTQKGYGGAGGFRFLSTKASIIIIQYFEKCGNNQFHKDKETDAYPFMAEDMGHNFVLCKFNIQFVTNPNLYANIIWGEDDIQEKIAIHYCFQGQPCLNINNLPKKINDLLISG